MEFKNILITGGAGFVGSNLAVMLREAFPDVSVAAIDSLKRRGSELTLGRLKQHGVLFQHGDIRCREDLENLPDFDLLIDCAAEPSVHAGVDESPRYLLNANLAGTINALEAARVRSAAFLLLSSSRVYPIRPLNDIPYSEAATRFQWQADTSVAGFSEHGIAEDFPLEGARSFYGTSKLASELLLQEYVYAHGMRGLINRCGVLAGPWQMGKVDQGVITLWVARHYFDSPLRYIGYGGGGKQVRDVLHVADLFDLLVAQMRDNACWDGRVYNIGGGPQVSTSLLELTRLCETATGNRLTIGSVAETNDMDLRIYLTDARKAQADFAWKPARDMEQIVTEIRDWVHEQRDVLRPLLA